MELYTRISIPQATFTFSQQEPILLLGSCFADNISKKLEENKFITDTNPFGTLYNPASIAEAIKSLLEPKPFTCAHLFLYEGMYHSFAHHSRFSAVSETECLERINNRFMSSAAYLKTASRLIITFGTAYVYRLKSSGQIVSNCHKLPEKRFDRQRLSVEEIVSDWKKLLPALWAHNRTLKLLFTVSPIRHWKDGAQGNQLSKATLLLAIDRLQQAFPEQVAYFPAYEILMDELRDYRFYADDMLHPSPLAIDYIWQRFTESMLSKEAQALLKEWEEIRKAIQHKPFRPDSEAYQRFISQTLLKMERISRKFPSFDIINEIGTIKSKLK